MKCAVWWWGLWWWQRGSRGEKKKISLLYSRRFKSEWPFLCLRPQRAPPLPPLGWIRSAASCTSLVSPRTLPSSYRFPIPICQESLLHRLLPFCPSSGDLLSISKILGLWPTHWGCVWVSTVLPLMLLPVQGGSARSGKELIDMNAELETTHFKHHLTSEAHRRGSYSDSNNVYTSICKCLRTSHSLPFTRSALWRSAFSVTT